MFRRELLEILEGRPWSMRDLAAEVEEPIKGVADDVEHLLKSIRHMPYESRIYPATCRKCGFEFENRRLTKPSKCPKCKSSWISEPRVELVRTDT